MEDRKERDPIAADTNEELEKEIATQVWIHQLSMRVVGGSLPPIKVNARLRRGKNPSKWTRPLVSGYIWRSNNQDNYLALDRPVYVPKGAELVIEYSNFTSVATCFLETCIDWDVDR